MRVDFREERKWKIALAFNLSTAVLEWHAASGPAERVGKGICVLWKRPHVAASDVDETTMDVAEEGMVIDDPCEAKKLSSMSIVEYGSEDEDEDEEQDKERSVFDALEPSTLIQEALENAEQVNNQSQDASSRLVEPKVEDVDDESALQHEQVDAGGDSMDVDVPKDPIVGEDIKPNMDSSSGSVLGLKATSSDPVLGSTPNMHGESDANGLSSKSASKSKIYAPLRERIAYSDVQKLFLELDDLELVQEFTSLSTDDKPVEIIPPAPDLSAIFPDLPPYGLLDVTSPIAPITFVDGRRREKRADRDDPNRRAEDTTYTRLTPLGKFMHCKPILLGPLQPAKRFVQGQWRNFDEGAVVAESDGPFTRVPDDITSGGFSNWK
jgi:chromatin modification-related protein VID21